MTARGGGPTPAELRGMGPRGVPTYPLGIAERWHRNLQSQAKERNPGKPPRRISAQASMQASEGIHKIRAYFTRP